MDRLDVTTCIFWEYSDHNGKLLCEDAIEGTEMWLNIDNFYRLLKWGHVEDIEWQMECFSNALKGFRSELRAGTYEEWDAA